MLLQFTFGNFRSFKNKTTLNMKASTQRTPFAIEPKDGARALPAAVIYGPNASGKTNIIKAAFCMRTIVLQGFDGANKEVPLPLALYPFVHKLSDEPVAFEIAFIMDRKRFDYELAFSPCNSFSNSDCEIAIVNERLAQEGELLFERTIDKILVSRSKKALKLLGIESEEHLRPLEASVNSNMSKDGLFLTGGLLSTISKPTASKVVSFFKEKFEPMVDIDGLCFGKFNADEKVFAQTLTAIKVVADVGPQEFYAKQPNDDAPAELFSIYQVGAKGEETKGVGIPIEWMESKGTIEALHLIPILLDALLTGKTLLIDELDVSLHPELVTSIIATFNDEQLNPKRAQLIFTTHNLTYLNKNLLRRDQILFTEKNEDYVSELYSLADFGSDVVRNDGSFVKQYLKGNFGALPTNSFAELVVQNTASEDEEAVEQ